MLSCTGGISSSGFFSFYVVLLTHARASHTHPHARINAHTAQVNGLGQAFGALARGIGPWLGGALWSAALSLDSYYAAYLVHTKA